MSMTGTFRYGLDQAPVSMPDFNCFYRFAASFPWRSHAVWFLTQMIRWGQIESPIDLHAVAAQVYRPDIYREAASALGLSVPEVDTKLEGTHDRGWTLEQATTPLAMGPDRFFDGLSFDPADPVGYLDRFAVSHRTAALEDLARTQD
jgi:nitrate/nitrite transport system substrate-binding protein